MSRQSALLVIALTACIATDTRDLDMVERRETSSGPQTSSTGQTDSVDDGIGDVCDDTPM